MASLPKRGRPSIGDAARVQLNVRVSPTTADAIDTEATARDISRGVIVDELVARTLLRKRKTT